jgi:hypothetical protein
MRGHLSFARFAHACGLAFADARKAFTIELLAGEVNTSAAAEYVTHDRAMTLAEELELEGWGESALGSAANSKRSGKRAIMMALRACGCIANLRLIPGSRQLVN